MRVKALLEALSGANPEAEVILQQDAEGNGYSPLYAVDVDAVYVPDCTWSGTAYSMEWSASDADMSRSEWAVVKAMPRCVVLAPVN